ncbi:hypothetical protein C8250_028885 [Streptomyces sp. So13.3]|uniref:hypothetical protein n=1 Tax=Streptomyces sp. So13.3 TaxID=2136173 RepID=UPI001106D86B|nr:hypothetical protein [Streptomyces sp. So13.3]QNA75369.1 hypothetical protein C8250_028885 [Streptomyces sp. So13.3]
MTNVFERDEFISQCVDYGLKSIGQGGHPLSSEIKEFILREVVVSSETWQAVLGENSGGVDVTQLREIFELPIKETFQFFPLDYLTADDLPIILRAVRLKYQPMMAAIWPAKELLDCLRDMF